MRFVYNAQQARLFSDPGFRLELDSSQSDGLILYVHGDVGIDDGLDSGSIVPLLAGREEPLVIDINSRGGSAFDGISIYNAIESYAGPTMARVTGLAASAASLIAIAADEVQMARNASMQIHLSQLMAIGNRYVMEDAAAALSAIDEQLVGLYADRMEKPAEEVYQLLRGDVDGTLFSAKGAIEAGLADRLIPSREERARQQEAQAIMAARFQRDVDILRYAGL